MRENFLKILPLKDDELVLLEITDFASERTCQEKHLNLSKSGFVSEEDQSGCKSQNIAIRALKGSFSAKYGLNGPIKQIQSTGEVHQRTSSHLATIVSRALQPQDGRIPCPMDRNFLFVFGQSVDNCK